MEILFKNSFIKTEEWIKEVNKYAFLKRPLAKVFHLLSFLALCWGIYKILFLHTIDILFLFIPLWWFFLVLLLYFKTNKNTLNRNRELYGDNAEVVSEITKDSIKQVHSNGTQYQIYYDTIKKGYLTQNYILLHSKANVLYTFAKNGFSVGNEEDFFNFLIWYIRINPCSLTHLYGFSIFFLDIGAFLWYIIIKEYFVVFILTPPSSEAAISAAPFKRRGV